MEGLAGSHRGSHGVWSSDSEPREGAEAAFSRNGHCGVGLTWALNVAGESSGFGPRCCVRCQRSAHAMRPRLAHVLGVEVLNLHGCLATQREPRRPRLGRRTVRLACPDYSRRLSTLRHEQRRNSGNHNRVSHTAREGKHLRRAAGPAAGPSRSVPESTLRAPTCPHASPSYGHAAGTPGAACADNLPDGPPT